MSAQVTEAHKQLVATIVEQAFRFAEGNHKITPLSQLIADSEAKATAQANAQVESLISSAKNAIPASEHPAEPTVENWAWQIRNLGADRRLVYAEHDQLRADRDYNHECINRLASATGTLGEKSEKIVDFALSTIEQLRAEVKESKARERAAIASWDEERQRALRESGRVVELRAELAAAKLFLDKEIDCAEIVEAAMVHQYARAEGAEAELAKAKAVLASIEEDGTEEHNAAVRLRQELATERARLDWLGSDAGMEFQWETTTVITRAEIEADMKEETK